MNVDCKGFSLKQGKKQGGGGKLTKGLGCSVSTKRKLVQFMKIN